MSGLFKMLTVFLLFWLVYRYVRYLIVTVLGPSSKNTNSFNGQQQRPTVDSNPMQQQTGYEGGEYIEYEEVKD